MSETEHPTRPSPSPGEHRDPSGPEPKGALDRIFDLTGKGTSARIEVLAGCTTFLTMAYIIFVQPAMLSGRMFETDTGMDFGAVMFATCVSSAIATLVMGLAARYPIALAPGMGINAFFTLTLLPAAAMTNPEAPWQTALGVVLVSGVFFLFLTFLGVREKIIDSVSPSLKNATAVGIGLFIAFMGLQNGGLILRDPATYVTMNDVLYAPDLVVFFFGLAVTAILHSRRVMGSILWGILAATVMALILKHSLPADTELVKESQLMTKFKPAEDLVSLPPSPAPTFFHVDIAGVFSASILPFVVVFLFVDMFDTIGTLIGVAEQGGFIRGNRLPRAGRALAADAVGTIAGSLLGTSTVTSYIESAAGVESGGRTGLTAVVVACLFVFALLFSPIVAMVGSYPAITAPALVLVGAMMCQNARKIDWQSRTEALPAFLIIIGIPLTFSIGDGLAIGFVTYPFLKIATGKARDVSLTMYILAVLLLLYFVFIRAEL